MIEIYVDRSTQYFGRIPDWLNDSDVSDAGYRLYGNLMTRYGGYKQGIFPSQERLAKELNKSVKSVYNAMQELIRVGAVRVRQRGLNKTNEYELAFDHCFHDEYTTIDFPKAALDRIFNDPAAPEIVKDILRNGIVKHNARVS